MDLPEFQWGRRRDHFEHTSIISPLKIMMNQDLDLILGLVMEYNGMVVWGYQLQLVHSHNSEHPNLETGGL